jgi:hypothetical protein
METDKDGHFVTLSTCNGLSGTQHRLIVCGKQTSVDKLQAPASWYDGYRHNYDEQISALRRMAEEIAAELQSRCEWEEDSIFEARHS